MAIRHCGLQDENTWWINNFMKSVEINWHSAFELSQKFISKSAKNILDGSWRSTDYSNHWLILSSSSIYNNLNSKWNIPQWPAFDKHIKWYDFKVGFVKLSKPKESPRVAWIFIDDSVINKTKEELWNHKLKTLEKAIWYLYTLSNHDSSIHSTGFVVDHDNFQYANTVSQEAFTNYNAEELAIMFHKDYFKKLCNWTKLKKKLLLKVEDIFKIISQIQDSDIKYYWNQILKNSLFMLIDPEDEDLKDIKKLYPSLNLESTYYISKLHKDKLVSSYTYKDIPISELSKVTINSMKSKWIPWELIKLIKWNKLSKKYEKLKYKVYEKTSLNFGPWCEWDILMENIMRFLAENEFKFNVWKVIIDSWQSWDFINKLKHSKEIEKILSTIGKEKKYSNEPWRIMEFFED